MNIAYSSSNEYSWLMGISIFSLLANNPDEKIHFYILSNGISSKNRTTITKMIGSFGQSVDFLAPEKTPFEELLLSKDRWGLACLQKIRLQTNPLPNLDRILYLDSDTIVRGPIRDFYDSDLHGAIVGGMYDGICQRQRTNLGMERENPYFNAGILLIDEERARKANLSERYSSFLNKVNGILRFQDQDLMNASLKTKEKCVLPFKYDAGGGVFFLSYKQYKQLRKPALYYSETEFNETKNNPVIVHFYSFFLETTRVWNTGSKHPFKAEFFDYKNRSPYKDVSLPKDSRPFFKKIILKIVHYFPHFLTIPLVSFFYNYVIPKKYAKALKKTHK